MCSIGDDNLDDLENLKYMTPKEKPSQFTKCNKCREGAPIVVLRSKDKYCKECFLAGVVHKFKALLGKHKLIRPNDRVLLVHRCGHPSTALLHFIRTGMDLETHKKLRFATVVLFIEDSYHLSLPERQQVIKRVEMEAQHFKLPVYFTSLAHLLSNCNVQEVLKHQSETLEVSDDDKNIMNDFLSSQTNSTNKLDFLNISIQNFLIEIAKNLHCNFIFTPELSNDVASQLLTDISLGRGSHVALNTGFCDSRDPSVKILRPLRLFDAKELAFYNHLNNLEPVTYASAKENPYKSVQSLMRKFVTDLQVNYPATVTTILKTGDKLALSSENSGKCDFCKGPIGEKNCHLGSAESTQFSHWVSTHVSDSSASAQERFSRTLDAFNSFSCDDYCFSCRKLVTKQ